MRHITLNGESREWPRAQSIEHLLLDLNLDGRVVAVELNRLVVKRGRYVDTLVDDGDEVEIVSFVGGG
ncbi:MAG: sulfur carrier protein ThiS [Acidobacteria bacterium]|jgi:thiamine biosynthesis protein ThiS|nr:sulfur carrier protein ThiS [Acidobacteriota bacterium]